MKLHLEQTPTIWVLEWEVHTATLELLGDARAIADRLDASVGVLVVSDKPCDTNRLVSHGADFVRVVVTGSHSGGKTRLREALSVFQHRAPRLVLVSGTVYGREWASLLAAANGWRLVSPTLRVQCCPGGLEAIALDTSGRLSRSDFTPTHETVVVTLRPGVGQALPAQADRSGIVEHTTVNAEHESIESIEQIEADPATMDICDATRLVAGGQGLGGREGFDVLRRFAEKLRAGIAASRMAVDLGWIERERQVGQTGKTVKPELYVACGVSGASHHTEGMSEARHVVAINTDPKAPIFKLAHLGLVADFRATIEALESMLERHRCE